MNIYWNLVLGRVNNVVWSGYGIVGSPLDRHDRGIETKDRHGDRVLFVI